MERKVSARLFVVLFAAVFALGIAPSAAFAAPSGNLAGASPQGGIAVQNDDGDDEGDDEGDDDWDYSYYEFEIDGLDQNDDGYYIWTKDNEPIGVESILVMQHGDLVDLDELGCSVKLYLLTEDDRKEVSQINGEGSYEIVLVDEEGGVEVASHTVQLFDYYSLSNAGLFINGERAWCDDAENPRAISEGDVKVAVYPFMPDVEDDELYGLYPLVAGQDYTLSFEDKEGNPVEAGKFEVGTVYFAVAKEVEGGDYTGECRAAFMLYDEQYLAYAQMVIDGDDELGGCGISLGYAEELSASDVEVFVNGKLINKSYYTVMLATNDPIFDRKSAVPFEKITETGFYRLFIVASEAGAQAGYTDAGEDSFGYGFCDFTVYADNDLYYVGEVTDVDGMAIAKGQPLPAISVTVEDKPLVEGTDYRVDYYSLNSEGERTPLEDGPTDVGEYDITIVGIGNYTGELNAGTFEIVEPNSLKLATVKVEAQGRSMTFPVADDSDEDELLLDYTGEVIEPKFTVTFDGKELPSNALHFDVSSWGEEAEQILNRGKYNVVITADEYSDSLEVDIYVATIIKDEDVTIEEGPFTFSGEPVRPEVTVKFGDDELVEGEDYSVEYYDNKQPGIGTVYVWASGEFIYDMTRTFVITDLGEDATEEEKAKAAADAEAAKAVVDLINALADEVETDAEKEAVDAAKAAYDKLTDDQKALIGAAATDKLDDAIDSAKWYAIDAVEAAINALPETVASDADKAAVDAAKAAYDKLTDEQKALIGPKALSKLNNAVKSAESYKPAKKANTMTAKAKAVKAKAKKLKKKAQKIAAAKAIAVGNPQGNVTYKLKSVKAKKKLQKQAKKKIKMASNGQITLKKKLKKGTYTLTVDVTAAGNADYNAVTKTVTVKIKVK